MSTEPPIPAEPGEPTPNPLPGPTTAPEPTVPDAAPDPGPAPANDPPGVGDEPRAFARTPHPPLDRAAASKLKHVPLYGDMWGTGAEPRPYDMPGLAPDYPDPRAPNVAVGPRPGPGQFSAPQPPAEGSSPSEPPPASTKP